MGRSGKGKQTTFFLGQIPEHWFYDYTQFLWCAIFDFCVMLSSLQLSLAEDMKQNIALDLQQVYSNIRKK